MKITQQEIDHYKTKIYSECPKIMTKIQWAVFTKLITRNKKESFEDMAKEFKMKVVHFDSAAMVASHKIKKFLREEGLSKEECDIVLSSI